MALLALGWFGNGSGWVFDGALTKAATKAGRLHVKEDGATMLTYLILSAQGSGVQELWWAPSCAQGRTCLTIACGALGLILREDNSRPGCRGSSGGQCFRRRALCTNAAGSLDLASSELSR